MDKYEVLKIWGQVLRKQEHGISKFQNSGTKFQGQNSGTGVGYFIGYFGYFQGQVLDILLDILIFFIIIFV